MTTDHRPVMDSGGPVEPDGASGTAARAGATGSGGAVSNGGATANGGNANAGRPGNGGTGTAGTSSGSGGQTCTLGCAGIGYNTIDVHVAADGGVTTVGDLTVSDPSVKCNRTGCAAFSCGAQNIAPLTVELRAPGFAPLRVTLPSAGSPTACSCGLSSFQRVELEPMGTPPALTCDPTTLTVVPQRRGA